MINRYINKTNKMDYEDEDEDEEEEWDEIIIENEW
jgi:hypothetical protein